MFKNEYTLTVDLKKSMSAVTPKFVQYDNATLVFKILDNGRVFDLTGFTKAEVAHKRPDGVTVIGTADIESSNGKNVIRYNYLGSEMHKEGYTDVSLSIFSDNKKVSIYPFKVEIVKDIRDEVLENAKEEVGLLQELIAEVSDILDQAHTAIESANNAVEIATKATSDATDAVANANLAITNAQNAAVSAEEKALLADNAAKNANAKAELAESNALLAQESATNANNAVLGIDEAINNTNLATTNANDAANNANIATANFNEVIQASDLATQNANTAATNAINAKDQALSAVADTLEAKNATELATNNANVATTNANKATDDLTKIKNDAIAATFNANTSATNANVVIGRANTSANNAQSVADNTASHGAFVLGKSYKKNNLVLDNGSTWIALLDTQNNPLPTLPVTENSWWRLVAQRGVDGTGSVVSVNDVFPDVNGNVVIDLGNAITKVDGFSPDSNGNVSTHANKTVLDALTDDAGQLKYNGSPVGSVTSVNGQTGDVTVQGFSGSYNDLTEVPTEFKPEAHNHSINEVTGLSTELDKKVDKATGKGLSTEDFTTAEKTKLSSIANNANNYVHPTSHPASIITQDTNNRFVTDAEKVNWNAKASNSVATASENGLMSSTDKSKLNGIEDGAQVNTITSVNGQTGAITGLATDSSVDNKIGLLNDDVNAIENTLTEHTSPSKQDAHAISNISGLQSALDSKSTFSGNYNDLTNKPAAENLSALTTTNKTSLVGAINEINAKPSGGGTKIPVGNVSSFTANGSDGQVVLTWGDPNDVILDGIYLARWAGTKILRKEGSYPSNENDGVLVVNSGVRNQYVASGFVDRGLTNDSTYYYSAFPYTQDGRYDQKSDATATPMSTRIYGVKIDKTNSNPFTAVSYTDNAIGFSPANGNNGVFNYGSWADKFPFNQIKPCLYKNGVVNYYLNPNDYTKKEDGTASDITSGNDGDVMVEFPKIYWKFETVGNDLYIKYSDKKVGSGYKCLAHTRGSAEKEYAYLSAYMGNEISSKLRSLSGKVPTASKTISAFRTLAQANGVGYDQIAYYQLLMLQVLFVVMFKSRDSQLALGRGYVDGNSALIATGGANKKGMFYGETTGKLQNKFCGIEDFWGNANYWIDGIFSDASRNILIGTEGFNNTGSGYSNYGQGATADITGYISDVQGGTETGFIVKAPAVGAATTYYADRGAISTSKLAYFGGRYDYADIAGAFYLQLNVESFFSEAGISSRLMVL